MNSEVIFEVLFEVILGAHFEVIFEVLLEVYFYFPGGSSERPKVVFLLRKTLLFPTRAIKSGYPKRVNFEAPF